MRILWILVILTVALNVWAQEEKKIEMKPESKKSELIINAKTVDLGEIEGVEIEAMKPALSSVIRRRETRSNAGKKIEINKKIKKINRMLY